MEVWAGRRAGDTRLMNCAPPLLFLLAFSIHHPQQQPTQTCVHELSKRFIKSDFLIWILGLLSTLSLEVLRIRVEPEWFL